ARELLIIIEDSWDLIFNFNLYNFFPRYAIHISPDPNKFKILQLFDSKLPKIAWKEVAYDDMEPEDFFPKWKPLLQNFQGSHVFIYNFKVIKTDAFISGNVIHMCSD